jgi:hypothetical protein
MIHAAYPSHGLSTRSRPRGSFRLDVRIMNDLTIFIILAAHETKELRAAHTSGVETQCYQLFLDVG